MINAISGGVLIGIAVSLMLLFNGKVTGISGIVGNLKPNRESYWRWFFVLGLLTGGVLIRIFLPVSFEVHSEAKGFDYAIAGFLVGVGTLLGNGCTSGHGVCGISRLSPRSILATVVFISFGVLSVIVFKILRGGL